MTEMSEPREIVDGPPDELEPSEVILAELHELTRHPRAEAAWLRVVSEDGTSGATPLILIARIAARLLPILAAAVGIALAIYFRHSMTRKRGD
jgi:hypothetical protein